MKKSSFHILRVATAITFLWIGILILKEPEAWGSYLQPWVVDLLPVSIKEVMISTAITDIIIGLLLLVDFWVPVAAFLAAAHMLIVIGTSGINEGTVRDIAILGGALALLNDSIPADWRERLERMRSKPKTQ